MKMNRYQISKRDIKKRYINEWYSPLPKRDANWDKLKKERAGFQQINHTLYTFHDGTKYQAEKVCLPWDMSSGSKTNGKDQIPI